MKSKADFKDDGKVSMTDVRESPSESTNFLHCLCPFWQTLIHWWGFCQNLLLQSWEVDLQMNWSAPGALQRSQRLQVCVQSIFSIKYWHPLTGLWRNSIPCSTLISLQKEVDSNSFNFVLFPFYESVKHVSTYPKVWIRLLRSFGEVEVELGRIL